MKRLVFCNLLTLLIIFSIYGVYGQQKIFIPENNNDIQQLIDNLKQVSNLESTGYSYKCPEIDCDEAQEYIQILQDTELHLTLIVHWLIKANMGYMDHLESLHEQGLITNDNLAKAQWALGVEEFLHDMGSMLLDISSLSISLKEVVDDPAKLKSYKKKDLIDNIDRIYEGGKDFESLNATALESVLKGQSGHEAQMPKIIGGLTPDLLGIDEETLNDYKSYASDLKTIIEEYYDSGKDLRKAMKGWKGRAAIGQILGRFAKAYSQAEIEERKQHINSLIVNIAKEDATQAGILPDLNKIWARRYKAEDALNNIKKIAFDWGGNRGLWRLFRDACKNRKKITYGPYHNNEIPDYVYPENLTIKKIMITDYSGYGKALGYLNEQLPQLSERLLNIPIISEGNIPNLLLSKRFVNPDEEINVKFQACACYDKSANLKIVPSETQYGEDEENALVGLFNDLSQTSSYHIYGKTEGEASFKTPNIPGEYEVRLFNSQSSEEVVASAPFHVKTPPEEEITIEVGFKASNGVDEDAPAIMELKSEDNETIRVLPEATQEVPLGIYDIQIDYVSDGIEDIEMNDIYLTFGHDTLINSNIHGRLSMRAYDKNNDELHFFIRIYREDEFIKSLDGSNIKYDVTPGTYFLKFLVGDKNIEKVAVVTSGNVTLVEIRPKEDISDASKCPDIETGNATVSIRSPQDNGYIDDYPRGNFSHVDPSYEIWVYTRDLPSGKFYLTPVSKEFSSEYQGLWLVDGLNYKGEKGTRSKFGVILANSCANEKLKKNSSGQDMLPKGSKVMKECEVKWEESQLETNTENIPHPTKTPMNLENWLGRWSTNRGPINIRLEGNQLIIDLEPGGVLTRYDGKIEVISSTSVQIHGNWSTSPEKGTFTWKRDGRNFTGLFSRKVGDPETTNWEGSKE